MRKITTVGNTSKISYKMRVVVESQYLNESFIKISKTVLHRKKNFYFFSVFQYCFSFSFQI